MHGGACMVNVTQLKTANRQRWQNVNVTQSLIPLVNKIAGRLVDPTAKARYQAVSAKTTSRVPWAIIAVIHEREASQSWKANLAQGDPWNKVSIHVPAGRGPFNSWEDAAIDALMNCAPRAGAWTDWSIGGAL